ncbi:hypothetical protein QOT17_015946 [Balamuthia mandrillaris]
MEPSASNPTKNDALRKALLRWANHYLAKRAIQVESEVEFQEARLLWELAEAVSGQKVPPPTGSTIRSSQGKQNPPPAKRLDDLISIYALLSFFTKQGLLINQEFCCAKGLANGNASQLLYLLQRMAWHYEVGRGFHDSANNSFGIGGKVFEEMLSSTNPNGGGGGGLPAHPFDLSVGDGGLLSWATRLLRGNPPTSLHTLANGEAVYYLLQEVLSRATETTLTMTTTKTRARSNSASSSSTPTSPIQSRKAVLNESKNRFFSSYMARPTTLFSTMSEEQREQILEDSLLQAEKIMAVPKLLDAKDFNNGNVDRTSLFVYLAMLRKQWAKPASQKKEQRAKANEDERVKEVREEKKGKEKEEDEEAKAKEKETVSEAKGRNGIVTGEQDAKKEPTSSEEDHDTETETEAQVEEVAELELKEEDEEEEEDEDEEREQQRRILHALAEKQKELELLKVWRQKELMEQCKAGVERELEEMKGVLEGKEEELERVRRQNQQALIHIENLQEEVEQLRGLASKKKLRRIERKEGKRIKKTKEDDAEGATGSGMYSSIRAKTNGLRKMLEKKKQPQNEEQPASEEKTEKEARATSSSGKIVAEEQKEKADGKRSKPKIASLNLNKKQKGSESPKSSIRWKKKLAKSISDRTIGRSSSTSSPSSSGSQLKTPRSARSRTDKKKKKKKSKQRDSDDGKKEPKNKSTNKQNKKNEKTKDNSETEREEDAAKRKEKLEEVTAKLEDEEKGGDEAEHMDGMKASRAESLSKRVEELYSTLSKKKRSRSFSGRRRALSSLWGTANRHSKDWIDGNEESADSSSPGLLPAAFQTDGSEITVVALWDFQGRRADEVSFSEGDIIHVFAGGPMDSGWGFGQVESSKQIGLFPIDFTRIHEADLPRMAKLKPIAEVKQTGHSSEGDSESGEKHSTKAKKDKKNEAKHQAEEEWSEASEDATIKVTNNSGTFKRLSNWTANRKKKAKDRKNHLSETSDSDNPFEYIFEPAKLSPPHSSSSSGAHSTEPSPREFTSTKTTDDDTDSTSECLSPRHMSSVPMTMVPPPDQTLLMSNDDSRKGYLFLRGAFGQWKQRYFALTRNTMFYYKDNEELEQRPLGKISLAEAWVEASLGLDAKQKKDHCILIVQADTKSVFLHAGSREEMTSWLDAIRQRNVAGVRCT